MTEQNTIESFLLSYKDQHIYYMPNPGNGGDALIAYATFCLFDKLGLKYSIINAQTDVKDKIVFIGGGGNLVKEYDTLSNFIHSNLNTIKELVVLPHTINSHQELIKKMGNNVTLLCREQMSYDYVTQLNQNCRCYLIEDLAFTLPIDTLRQKLRKNILPIFLRQYVFKMFRYQGQVIRPWWNILFGQTLNAFRIDSERTQIVKPKNNMDLSLLILYDKSMCDKNSVERNVIDILSVLNKYSTVKTNRLHICIGAALLGKKVMFHPNSYYKNESIYLFSLKDKFPNVEWCS